jgi:ribosomal protein L40E
MASVYVHLSGRDLDPALAKLAGLEHEEASNGMRKVRICEKCRTANSPESSRCVQCLRPFVTTEEDEHRRTAQVVFNILRQFGVEVNEKQLTML